MKLLVGIQGKVKQFLFFYVVKLGAIADMEQY